MMPSGEPPCVERLANAREAICLSWMPRAISLPWNWSVNIAIVRLNMCGRRLPGLPLARPLLLQALGEPFHRPRAGLLSDCDHCARA